MLHWQTGGWAAATDYCQKPNEKTSAAVAITKEVPASAAAVEVADENDLHRKDVHVPPDVALKSVARSSLCLLSYGDSAETRTR